MRRSRIVIIAVLLAVVGAIVPIAAMLYVAWALAVKAEQDRLASVADQAITRANLSYADAKKALQFINASNSEPCSAGHIAEMRALTMNTRAVEEIGYFENHRLKCTSWGQTQRTIEQPSPDFATADGIEVTVKVLPLAGGGNKLMMALQLGSYNVLVDPTRFVDIIVNPGIGLAIARDQDNLIDTLNAPPSALLQSLPVLPTRGMKDNDLFAVARKDGWIAVATEQYAVITNNLRREQMLLLPVGLFIAAFIIGIVIWLSRRRLSLLGELALAVRNKEFVMRYQPIIELRTGRCVGAEALIRWRRPCGALVRPDLFIPLAEESGLIAQLTDQVIDNLISDLSRVLIADRSLHIAVNLSAAEIANGRFLPVMENAIKRADIRPQQIWLEVTERSFMDIESARVTIAKARAIGHPVVIDDFGTGYSSLQYLQGLPVDALKINKSFIDTIGMDAPPSSVTSHIIDMAKTLKLKIVAEGIERQTQHEYLIAHGVDFGQGWLFAKALPAEEFISFYRDRSAQRDPGAKGTNRSVA
jgi:sensor c-di-GMP phosphodiesterase-like protein